MNGLKVHGRCPACGARYRWDFGTLPFKEATCLRCHLFLKKVQRKGNEFEDVEPGELQHDPAKFDLLWDAFSDAVSECGELNAGELANLREGVLKIG